MILLAQLEISQRSNPDAVDAPAMGPIIRLKSLLENGWLAILKPSELSVWLVYHEHANKSDVSWPSDGLIAKTIGAKSLTHIRTARKKLIGYSLLKIVRGSGKQFTVRLLFAQIPGQDSVPNRDKIQSRNGTTPVPNRDQVNPESGPNQSRNGTTLYKDEQTIEHTNEQTTLFPALPGQGSNELTRRVSADQKPKALYTQLCDFWRSSRMVAHRGNAIAFTRRDGTIIAELWEAVSQNLPRAINALTAYLADRTASYEGHALNLFKRDMPKFITRGDGETLPVSPKTPTPNRRKSNGIEEHLVAP